MKKNRLFPFLIGTPLFCLLAISILTGIFACQKEEEPLDAYIPPPKPDYNNLPPETQFGNSTFGCKVNGEVWIPRVPLIMVLPMWTIWPTVTESDSSGSGYIACNLLDNKLKKNDYLELHFPKTYFKTGILKKYDENGKRLIDCCFRSGSDNWYIIHDKDSLFNTINLSHISDERNIVSGTFKFKLYNKKNENDKVTISEGRFDLKYMER